MLYSIIIHFEICIVKFCIHALFLSVIHATSQAVLTQLAAESQNFVNAKQKIHWNVDCLQPIPPGRVTTAGIQEMLHGTRLPLICILSTETATSTSISPLYTRQMRLK